MLQIRGTADISIVDDVDADYLAASRRLVDPDDWNGFGQQVHHMYQRMARIEITRTWAKIYDFTTRLPKTLTDLTPE